MRIAIHLYDRERSRQAEVLHEELPDDSYVIVRASNSDVPQPQIHTCARSRNVDVLLPKNWKYDVSVFYHTGSFFIFAEEIDVTAKKPAGRVIA